MTACVRFVGLDIGASTITAAALGPGLEGDGATAYVASLPSAGLSHGRLVDRVALGRALGWVLTRLSEQCGAPVEGVALGIPGSLVRPLTCSAERHWPETVRIDSSVLDGLRRRALHSAVASGPVLAATERVCAVDGHTEPGDPARRVARHVRIDLTAYVVASEYVDDLARLLDPFGVRVDALVPHAMAGADACLTAEERESGVVAIDIGATSTDVAVYLSGALRSLFSLPAGGETITRDLATVLGLPHGLAERAKLCGLRPEFLAQGVGSTGARLGRASLHHDPSEDEIAVLGRQVAGARVQQILERVRERLDEADLAWRLLSGAVLFGGGARLRGLTPAAQRILGMPVRVGAPAMRIAGAVGPDPIYATAIGLALAQARLCPTHGAPSVVGYEPEGPTPEDDTTPPRSGVVPALGRWLREFVPLGEGV